MPHRSLLLVGGQQATDATPVAYLIDPGVGTTEATVLFGDTLGNRAYFGYAQSGDVVIIYGGREASGECEGGSMTHVAPVPIGLEQHSG